MKTVKSMIIDKNSNSTTSSKKPPVKETEPNDQVSNVEDTLDEKTRLENLMKIAQKKPKGKITVTRLNYFQSLARAIGSFEYFS